MIPSEAQRGRGEGENVKKEAFFFLKKRVCLGCVLYPTGSMQQLLNGRAALPDLYRQGRGFAPVHGGKKRVYYHHLVADAVLT